MRPKFCLTAYQNDSNDFYFEVANFRNVEMNIFDLGAFHPLSKRDVFNLKKAVINVKDEHVFSFSGFMDSRVVYKTEHMIAWRIKKGIRKIFLIDEDKTHERDILFPNSIFCVINSRLSLYCYDKWRGEKTIFSVPKLPNTSMDGNVCLGTNKLGQIKSQKEYINNAERIYFDSPFVYSANYEYLLYSDRLQFDNNIPWKRIFQK